MRIDNPPTMSHTYYTTKVKIWIFMLAYLFFGGVVCAQSSLTVPFILRVDPINKLSAFTYPGPVTLNFTTTFTGASVTPDVNSNMYLRITSVASANTTHCITAELNSSTPAGIILKLLASIPTYPALQGNFGTSILPAVTLQRNVSTTIIEGIKSCYSGTGNTDGYKLTFYMYPDYDKYDQIKATSTPAIVEVKFTLTSSM